MLIKTICHCDSLASYRYSCLHLALLLILIGAEPSQARIDWVRRPENTALRLGDDLTISCQAVWVEDNLGVPDSSSHFSSSQLTDNLPPPTLQYTWSLNQTSLPEKATRLPDKSLFVPGTAASDLGVYTCTVTAHFEDGDSGRDNVKLVGSALVAAAFLRPFVIHPESQAVSIGETAILTCVTGVSSPVVEVSWLRNGLQFTQGTVQTATFGGYDRTGLTHQLSLRLTVEVSSDLFGQFQCRAWNPVLREFELSDVADVSNEGLYLSVTEIDLPVILWDHPPSLVVGEGTDLILPCKSTESTESTKVSWYLGRYRVDESKRVYALLDPPNHSLGFFPVRQQDSGRYSCRAENSKGIVESPPLELVIAYLGIEFAASPVDTFAVYGTTAVLHCDPPDSIPEAHVFWYKDYLPLNTFDEETVDRISVTEQGDLQLTSVRKSDKGVYYCEAYNNFTTPTSRTSKLAVLTVEGPPFITLPPTAVEVMRGTLLHLKCLVDADPTPSVTWLYGGQNLSASSTVAFVNRSQELIVSDVDKTREGTFTCKASNSYGSITADAYVTVIVPPESLRPIGDIIVTTGESAQIHCPVLSDPMPNFLWFYNSTQLYPEDRGVPSDLQWRVDLPDLVLENIRPQNAGQFTCVGVNKGGTASSTGLLVVNVPPSVSVNPRNLTAVMGQRTTLSCVAEGQPTPSIRWLYNTSKDLPAEAELSGDKSTLTLAPMTWTGIGTYTCVGENLVGQAQTSAEVKILTKPKIIALEAPESAVQVNTKVTLKCIAEGIPAPLLTWTHLNQTVVPLLNGRVRLPERGVLVLEAVLLEDSGQYECVASSAAGEDKAGITLAVYGPPPPPVLLKAVPLSSESVYLIWKWSKPSTDPQQAIDGFKIWYRERQAVTPILYPAPLGNTSTRHEVTGLTAHQEYVFYVTAFGDSGRSIPSNVMSAITLQSEPAAPENLRTIEVAKRSATLIWEVPAVPNGVVREYQLRYKRTGYIYADYTMLNITHPDLPTHEMILVDLRPYTEYTVEVRAGNVQSGVRLWGEFSPPLLFGTLMSEPSLPPQFVEVTSQSPYSVLVSWQPIPSLAQNGPILFYHVTYTNIKTGRSEAKRVDQATTSLTIFGLSPWRNYSVTVKGQNPKGFSPASDAVTELTHPIAPVAPPGNLKVISSTASTLTLTWQALPDQLLTCNITSYRVEYRQRGDVTWLSQNVTSDSIVLQLEALSPWTWYETRVAAVTASLTQRLGPFTEPVLTRTQQGESERVTAVTYSIGEDSITLSWQPPKEVHGTLVGYKVSYVAIGDEKSSTSAAQEVLVYSNKSLSLDDLHPGTLYQISISAVNGAGPGRETTLKLNTLPSLPAPLTTEYPAALEVSSVGLEFFNGSEINLSESSSNRHIRRNLAAIVAGCLVGAVALIICTIFVCIQCIRYRRKQRLNYDVSEDRVIIENDSSYYRPNESSPPAVKFTPSTKQSVSFFSSSSASSPPSPSSPSVPSSVTRESMSTQIPSPTNQMQTSTTSSNGPQNQNQSQAQITFDKETDSNSTSSTPSARNDGKEDSSALVRLRKPDVSKKKYSKLDEDFDTSQKETSGLENPVYLATHGKHGAVDVDDVVLMVDDSLSSFSSRVHRHSLKSFDDTDSVTSETMRRRNRMRTESAAAIAAMRSTIYVDSLDMASHNSKSILGNGAQEGLPVVQQPEEDIEDFGSEVIFNERTVL
ncbi:down syndrome cell adhesion molecule-like protein 1 homolog [Elysia marginata]|uniref:Down syndrome cell adhesion molecule-like protein 1 homolog n=1 Tax=Elysia marginata TaxID=1093978 RepID=A0AAV4FT41_9GAST|nr:down syndrome cell adhesion molecule-like protein 1 homolog [Elysia marginata]